MGHVEDNIFRLCQLEEESVFNTRERLFNCGGSNKGHSLKI